ncbi:MAG: TlpA family protein disulfide reductase [Actinobacteria bacterium]|nr:TlpA family protein disulfide reductase [Actinomycetota bacterium]
MLVARDTGPARATPSPAAERDSGLRLAGTDPVTGKPVSLAQFRGKPVVINIWASWCPGCYAEADDLARFAAEYPEVAVVGINLQDSAAGAREFYQRYGWTFPSIGDPSGEIARRLGLKGMPTTIFLDAEHRESARIVGETDLAGFIDGLSRATGA